MKKNLPLTLFIAVVFALFSPNLLIAQGKGSNQWYLTPRVGVATILNEVGPGFSSVESDFQHGIGFSGDLSISRTIGSHLELGLGIGFYNLSSTNDSVMVPDLVAFKEARHSTFAIEYYPTVPIEYQTAAIVPSLFLRYYVKQFASSVRDQQLFQPYIELSAGLNVHSPELNYTDTSYMNNPRPEELPSVWIPTSDTEIYEPPYQPTEQAMQFAMGIGSKFSLPNGLTFNLAAEISGISTEYMDGTPNPIADEVSSGLVTRVLFGVAIPIYSGKGSGKGNEYFPWAP